VNKYFIFAITLVYICSPFAGESSAQEALSWQDCVKEAARNHPDLISSLENINQLKESKNITASTLYPQIDADAGASRAKTTGAAANSYSYGVSGTQLVFDGLKTVNDVNAAKANLKAGQKEYKFVSTQVRMNLRTAFVSLLRAQELIKVSEEIVKIRRDNLILITLRYQSGLEHKGALLTAEANVLQAHFELSQAKRDVVLAQRQLIKEMGRKEFASLEVKGDFSVQDSAKEKPDLEALVKNNPSLLQASAKTSAAFFGIRSAYANFSPQVSGSAGADKSGSHWPPQSNQWNMGVSVNMPIFEGGLRLAQVVQAQAAYRQAGEDERSTKDSLIVGLEQTWVSLQDAIETVDVQRKTLEATEERSKIAEAQYSTGFITFDNWIIIEDDLVKAKRNYLNTQANALIAEANWIQAKGETLEYENQ